MKNTNRTRGHSFEREVAISYRELFPNVQTSRYGSREADDRGIDLINTEPFAFQCKRVKKLAVQKHLDYIQCKEGEIPAVILRKDKSESVVLLYKKDFDFLLHMGIVGNAVLNGK